MIRTYKYSLKAPENFAEDCENELRRMNDLWNRLIEIDRQRERSFKDLCRSTSAEYAAAQDEIEALREPIDNLYDAIRAERIATRSKEPSDELRVRKDELLGRRKALWEICKAIQKAIPKESQAPINEVYKTNVKLARQQSGCFWGNYNAVIESFETAKSKAIKDGGRLHFKSFDGSGRFVNQIQGGMTVTELLAGSHSQAQLTNLVTTNKTKGRFAFTAFTGKDDAGKRFRRQLFSEINYHRPIPADGVIKAVEVVKVPHDGKQKYKWHACFTVALPEVDIEHPKRNIVGVNLGWRQFGGRLRVAVVVDDAGKKTEYFVPAELVSKFEAAETIQKAADDARNEMLSWLRTFYQDNRDEAPLEWRKSIQELLRNRPSVDAANHLMTIWRECVFAQEESRRYAAWLKSDAALRRSYTGCRQNAVKWREEIYRHIAKELAERYAVLAITDTPLSTMARTKAKDDLAVDNALPESARRNRVIAAIYSLKEWIGKQAAKTGSTVETITGKTTATCHKCSYVAEKRLRGSQYATCKSCGSELELDENAAINCRNHASGAVLISDKPEKTGRFQRAKMAENDTARKIGDNASPLVT